MTLTPGADGKLFSHGCKGNTAVQVGEVSPTNFAEGKKS